MARRARGWLAAVVAGMVATTAPPAGATTSVPPANQVLNAVGGFSVTITWGDPNATEKVVLGIAIGERDVTPPEPRQMATELVTCVDGKPTAQLNSYTYLRDRFAWPKVDVFVTWSEYCVGDPYNRDDRVPYTLTIAQLPEFDANGQATLLATFSSTYVPGYRGEYSLAREELVAHVDVAPAPASAHSGGGSDHTGTVAAVLATMAAVVAGAGAASRRRRHNTRDVRRGEIDTLNQQLEQLRGQRAELQQQLHTVEQQLQATHELLTQAQHAIDEAQRLLREAQRNASSTDLFYNRVGLYPALALGAILALFPYPRRPGPIGDRQRTLFALVAGAVLTYASSWVSWDSAAVPPQLTAAVNAAEAQFHTWQADLARLLVEQGRLTGQISLLDAQIAQLEAQRSAAMASFGGAR